jgi:hypothetical protein
MREAAGFDYLQSKIGITMSDHQLNNGSPWVIRIGFNAIHKEATDTQLICVMGTWETVLIRNAQSSAAFAKEMESCYVGTQCALHYMPTTIRSDSDSQNTRSFLIGIGRSCFVVGGPETR